MEIARLAFSTILLLLRRKKYIYKRNPSKLKMRVRNIKRKVRVYPSSI